MNALGSTPVDVANFGSDLVDLSRAHRAGCPLRRRRRREDTLGALDGLHGVGEGCVVRSVPSRRGLAVARAAPSVPAILWLAAHPRRRLQAARFATRAATRTAKGSRWCAEVGRHTAGRRPRSEAAAWGTRAPSSGTIRGSSLGVTGKQSQRHSNDKLLSMNSERSERLGLKQLIQDELPL